MTPLLCAPNACTGCTACAAVCPQVCIAMRPDGEGFAHPVVDPARCIDCGLCTRACPVLQPDIPPLQPSAVYAARTRRADVLRASSSGGIFSLLAERVLAAGGMVFGAGFGAGLRVAHKGVENAAGLAELRGSKYVQSDLGDVGDVLRQVRRLLASDRQVLFSGTPCQVAGLHAVLDDTPANLLCVDVVCHGVPSPRVFDLWKQALERRYGSPMTAVAFRDKTRGWHAFSLAAAFANGRACRGTLKEEPYLLGFLSNLFLRPACHACRFKNLKARSDVTLADYWGLEPRFPCFADDRGASLVLVNTPAGARACAACAADMECHASDYAHAVATNPMITRSARAHPRRARFFEGLETRAGEGLLLRMARLPLRRKALLVVRRALTRIRGS